MPVLELALPFKLLLRLFRLADILFVRRHDCVAVECRHGSDILPGLNGHLDGVGRTRSGVILDPFNHLAVANSVYAACDQLGFLFSRDRAVRSAHGKRRRHIDMPVAADEIVNLVIGHSGTGSSSGRCVIAAKLGPEREPVHRLQLQGRHPSFPWCHAFRCLRHYRFSFFFVPGSGSRVPGCRTQNSAPGINRAKDILQESTMNM